MQDDDSVIFMTVRSFWVVGGLLPSLLLFPTIEA
jgi:hypothetical protein